MFQEQKGLEVFGGKAKRCQDLLRLFRLKRAEFELCMGVMVDRKIDPGVAPIADAIEEDDSLVLSPFMHALPVSRDVRFTRNEYSSSFVTNTHE
jgi:hypothetical protein